MSCGSFWTLCKSAEYVCQQNDTHSSYKGLFIWETIYLDDFWQVQKKHTLRELHDNLSLESYSLPNIYSSSSPISDVDVTSLCFCNSPDCILCIELPFRILTTCCTSDLIVAMASSSKVIMKEYLQFLIQNVSPLLKTIQMSNKSLTETGDTSNELQFIILKLLALIEIQSVGRSLYPNIQRHSIELFKKQFTYSPSSIRACSSCALWKNRYFRGSVYLTSEYFCFTSLDSQYKISIPLINIISFETCNFDLFQQPCITFSTSKFIEISCFEFPELSEFLSEFQKIWQCAMKNYLGNKITSRRRQPTVIKRHASLGCNVSKTPSARKIPLYSSPFKPNLFTERCVGSFRSTTGNEKSFHEMEGVIELSINSLYFYNPDAFTIILPFIEIDSIQRTQDRKSKSKLELHIGQYTLEIVMPSHEFLAFIFQLFYLQNCNEDKPKPFQLINAKHCEKKKLRKHSKPRLSLFDGRTKKLQLWHNYFCNFGSNAAMLRSKYLENLIKNGIPDEYRRFIWQFSCGSLYYHYQNEYSYDYYLHCDQIHSKAISQIERDIERTFPHHPMYRSGSGEKLLSLKNVLIAYSRKNPSVGYCQGMNVVVAILLLYLSEEEAFHCLSSICEKIVPGYFESNLWGIQLDQRVLDLVMKKHIPEIAEHIQCKIGGALLICFEWFMCFFGRSLLLDISIHIFDWVLLYGARALFITAIAVFKYLENDILMLTKPSDLIDKLKHSLLETIQSDNLKQLMLHYEGIITDGTIDYHRLTLNPDNDIL